MFSISCNINNIILDSSVTKKNANEKLATNGEKMIGRKITVHSGNSTEWFPLGGCSCFFSLHFCREQKVISRAARYATAGAACGRRRREESDSLFTRTMKGVPSRPLYGRDGGEVTNYSSLSVAPVFKGRAFHRNQATLNGRLGRPPGIPRPSIHHKRAATMLTTSFHHVVEDLSQPKHRITLSFPPKSLWSIQCLASPPLLLLDNDRFRRDKELLLQFVPV